MYLSTPFYICLLPVNTSKFRRFLLADFFILDTRSTQAEDAAKTGTTATAQQYNDDNDPDQTVISFSTAFPDAAESAVTTAAQQEDDDDNPYPAIIADTAAAFSATTKTITHTGSPRFSYLAMPLYSKANCLVRNGFYHTCIPHRIKH
jgi:hypothetical protein